MTPFLRVCHKKEHSSKWNTHIIKRNLIKMEHSYYQKEYWPSCFLVKWMILQWFPLKIFLTTSTCLFSLTQGSPPFLKLDFGLFSRLEPTIPFSHWSAVSPSKSRDFRLDEPTIPFSNWSAVSHPTSGHDVTRPIRSQNHGHLGPLYYC